MKEKIKTFLELKRKDFLFYALLCILATELTFSRVGYFFFSALFAFFIYLFFRANDIHPLRKREDEVDWEAFWKASEKLSEAYKRANNGEKKRIKGRLKEKLDKLKI